MLTIIVIFFLYVGMYYYLLVNTIQILKPQTGWQSLLICLLTIAYPLFLLIKAAQWFDDFVKDTLKSIRANDPDYSGE